MTRKRKTGSRPSAIPRHPWIGEPMLSAAHQLNTRCFHLLVQSVKARAAPYRSPALELIAEVLPQIDARACERAGTCPVLLLDLQFNVPESWDRIIGGATMSAPSFLFTQEAASPLLHEILMQAWSLAHSLPRAATLFFGMNNQVRESIVRLTGEEIDRIAQERARQLRPRWEDRRTFWNRLLKAAIGTDDEALKDVQLHCLSLLGGEFVPPRRTS